ncbi:hypothetical protein KBD71_02240 [Candidatus Woesebacteria bacterium]|nr:hypothetical protein [Candidatus Woesebacteria bacterium]
MSQESTISTQPFIPRRLDSILHADLFDRGYTETALQLMIGGEKIEGNEKARETKDPNVLQLADGRFRMYVSWGRSDQQRWEMGMFEANTLDSKEWDFIGTVSIDLPGDRVCAPAVLRHPLKNGKDLFIMDVQSECFASDTECVVYRGYSSDGVHFTRSKRPLVDKALLKKWGYEVSGVYDAGTSIVELDGKRYEVVLFSGYRTGDRMGFGDVYMIKRAVHTKKGKWEPPVLVINQDEIEFHNRPFEDGSEWGNEGAKVVQLQPNLFLWIFVSFLKDEHMKQRVTWATSRSLLEKPIVLGIPYPANSDQEHGHSDMIVLGDALVEIRQQRNGKDGEWRLVYAQHSLQKVSEYCSSVLSRSTTLPLPQPRRIDQQNRMQGVQKKHAIGQEQQRRLA